MEEEGRGGEGWQQLERRALKRVEVEEVRRRRALPEAEADEERRERRRWREIVGRLEEMEEEDMRELEEVEARLAEQEEEKQRKREDKQEKTPINYRLAQTGLNRPGMYQWPVWAIGFCKNQWPQRS